MIVKAFMALLSAITNVVFSILPDFPVLPSFIAESMSFMSDLMVSSAGIIRYILGDAVYLAALDYIVLLFTFNIFISLFKFIKNYILLK